MRFATPSSSQRSTLLLVVAASLFHANNTWAFVPLRNSVHQSRSWSPASGFVNNNQQKQPWNFQKELPPSAGALTTLSTISASSTSAAAAVPLSTDAPKPMSKLAKILTKIGMISYITTVAIGFITSLSIIKLLGYAGIPEIRRQKWALSTGQFVARWALRIFPFCKLDVIVDPDDKGRTDPEPAIWVCNHTSMLDVFLLLASDRRMRGGKKRPIKVVYVSTNIRNCLFVFVAVLRVVVCWCSSEEKRLFYNIVCFSVSDAFFLQMF